jgi:hypothetical protein
MVRIVVLVMEPRALELEVGGGAVAEELTIVGREFGGGEFAPVVDDEAP